jgi:flagellar export protein FliJ
MQNAVLMPETGTRRVRKGLFRAGLWRESVAEAWKTARAEACGSFGGRCGVDRRGMPRRFEFRLSTLLRVREMREREAQRRVGAVMGEIAKLDQSDAANRAEIARQQAELVGFGEGERRSATTIDAAQLSRVRAFIGHLQRELMLSATVRTGLNERLEALRIELQHARQQVRVLQKLRERRMEEHRTTLNRYEQAITDEAARRLPGELDEWRIEAAGAE